MKVVKFLFSPLFMGILFIVFAVSMAVATFIENDFGSAAAYSSVYNTRWFELVLLLLAVNLAGQVIEFRLYRKEKLTIFLFHASFIVILLGAAITRYFGYEGTIHIREGETGNKCYSATTHLGFTIKDESGKVLAEDNSKYSVATPDKKGYSRTVDVEGVQVEVVLAQVLTNATESIVENPSGYPLVSFYTSSREEGMSEHILRLGESVTTEGKTIGFGVESADINIVADSTGFVARSKSDLSVIGMMHGDSTVFNGEKGVRLENMQIIGAGKLRIIPKQFTMAGLLKAVTVDRAEQETGKNALLFHLFAGDKPVSVTLWENTSDYYSTAKTEINGKKVELFYGSSVINLPFELKLNDFILERYPGSSSPSGYKSDVLLTDKAAGVEKPFMIFMNNILKYKGYRFYQSSFDRDEKGTVLSVNHDKAGMTVTYTGYLLMMLFIILSMINKNSLLRNITPGYWTSAIRKGLPVVIFLVLFLLPREAFSQKLVADRKVADEFGKILVQDQKGRTKPLFTMSSDILRKVARENEYNGLSPMQVYLGLYLDFEHWQNEPLIRISNSDLAKKLGISGNMAAFSDLVDFKNGGAYKLQEDVQKVYAKAPGDRNKTDKEIMKVDERLNIVYMIYTGEFSRFFPLKDKSMHWANYSDAVKGAISSEDSTYLSNVIPSFAESLSTNNIRTGMQIAGSVREYQERFSEYSLPSKTRVNAEVFYYKAKIFERLFPFYATVGLVLIILLIVYIISDKGNDSIILRILRYLVFAGFFFHTIGLAIRWYIAGHSPMSNGYESMLFISWVMLLVGVIFSKKSPFAVPATAFLGSMTLMVAHLSFMDPEITNLVPVLKSYWLTMHVSVITGSYAFLGFGAVIGLIVMILLALSDNKNIARISSTIDELTVLNYQTMTLGLYFLTIGTFLGAVWANESWGRYWGWDPKETWSLITIIIYSIVIHSRLIPGLKDIYTFNLLSLFAFSSVLMTYFGVNYYLSGLHSYAAGDPVPVPAFVYVAVVLLVSLALVAHFRYGKKRM